MSSLLQIVSLMCSVYRFVCVLCLSCLWFGCGEAPSEKTSKKTNLITSESNADSNSQKLILSDQLIGEIDFFVTSDSLKRLVIDTVFQSIHRSVNKGFALMCKYKSENNNVLKTFVFDRDKDGALIQKNSFDAILLGKDTVVVEYPDLIMRFVEVFGKGERYYYNCWFSYNKSRGKYIFKSCISIQKLGIYSKYYVYFAEKESMIDQMQTDREVLSILKKYLN